MKTLRIVLMAILIIGVAGITPAAAADLTVVPQAGVVLVGEEGLTFTGPDAYPAGLMWFAPGDDPRIASPSASYTTQGPGNEVISPSTFQTRTGYWYEVDWTVNPATATAIINVQMPAIDVKVFNANTGEDLTNGEVIKTDTYMTFRVDSNLYQVINQRSINAEQSTDINVVVVDEEGAVFTALYADNGAVTSCPLTNLTPTTSQFYLPGVPQLDAVLNANWALDRPEYKTGVYSFYAQVNLNGAKDNVGTVTGCTKSRVYTLDVDKDDVMIETNKDVVVRKNDFSVTITGRPDKYYVLWVEGTSSVTAPDTIPSIKPNQDKVYLAGTAAGDNAALYQFRTGQAVEDDVCQNAPATGACFAMVKLSGLGRRTVGFDTDETTRDYTYTIRADYFPGNALAVPPVAVVANNPTSDTTRINVEKGGITIGTPGDGLYYMGEEIVLSGTNTDSDYTWLFITGPNLPSKGGSFHDIHDGVNSATDADGASVSPFYPDGQLDSLAAWRGETVGSDGTWEYRWNTKGEHLDAGTYSIYAVSTATNRDDLDTQDAIYDTAYLAIKEPFVTATASPATIAKGNDLFISGTATGDPVQGVAIWVLGNNSAFHITETVEGTGTFECRFANTENLPTGCYSVVVQHPMYDDLFDLAPQDNNPAAGQTAVVRPVLDAALVDPAGNLPAVFILDGPGSLQGSNTADALVTAMNNPDIDDTCYELTFIIEDPWIMIDIIGERHVGETIIIGGTTNLAAGDRLLVEFATTDGTTVPGSCGTALVTKGRADAENTWGFILDTSTYTPDDYVVTVEWIGATTKNTTQTFTLLEAGDEPHSSPCVTLPISSGWNLISTPVDTPVITATGFLYEDAYAYNTTTGTYKKVPLTDIVPGEGYWIGAFADGEIAFSGVPLTQYEKNLSPGWNLIGGVGLATQTGSIYANHGALLDQTYCYSTGEHVYRQASVLEPGVGYWLSSTAPCNICVNITPPRR